MQQFACCFCRKTFDKVYKCTCCGVYYCEDCQKKLQVKETEEIEGYTDDTVED